MFLFDPLGIMGLLEGLPTLRDALPDPRREGEQSEAFPNARKTRRQIYRILSNVHYPHLAALLRSLDFCIRSGFEQPTLLRTRAHSAFLSALSELHVAEHFLLRNFDIEGVAGESASGREPEFVVSNDDMTIAVEVYCPREWEGLAELTEALIEGLKNLDLAFDYRFAINVEQLDRFDQAQKLVRLHPAELARLLDGESRQRIFVSLMEEVVARLQRPGGVLRVVREQSEVNLRIAIELKNVQRSRSALPARVGTLSGPSLSGYAPEAMFDRLVARRVRTKARKGQAPGSGLAPLSLLVVDLSHSELTSQLAHPMYRSAFEQSLRQRLEGTLL
ncbi:MAG: hypothetical protein ACREA0_08645, partial [bacterium]